MITVTGATASGKTALAVRLAKELNGEIISADSRQVYRGMDIGTGKDLTEYTIDGKNIPYHLIDIVDAGYKYNVFQYQQDFNKVYENITERNKPIILCGGSGMYIDAVVNNYNLVPVPPNTQLRKELESKSHNDLIEMLSGFKHLHNTTDTDSKKRTIRAIEIEIYLQSNNIKTIKKTEIDNIYFEVRFDREARRKRITERLIARLEEGMINEVKNLVKEGISYDDLIFYGLEYKYVSLFLQNKLSYNQMFEQLNIAIHQFAKRQMTWFRGMERKGAVIHPIDGSLKLDDKIEYIFKILNMKEN